MKNLIFKTGNKNFDEKLSKHFDHLVSLGFKKIRAISVCQHLACTKMGCSFYNLEYRLGKRPTLP